MPDLYTKYQFDDAGNVIDPPTIPEYERRGVEAQASADVTQMELVAEDYADARRRVAERHNSRVDARAREDELLLAAQNTEQRQANEQDAAATRETRRRAQLDALRAEAAAGRTPTPDPQAGDPQPDDGGDGADEGGDGGDNR
jgi:hypothetical protein